MNQVVNQIKYVLIKAVKNARKNAIEVKKKIERV